MGASPTPNPLQLGNRLEDARFWTRIMKEHALFIQLGLPCDQTELIAQAKRFFNIFQRLQIRVEDTEELSRRLLRDLIRALNAFIKFKKRILRLMIECEIQGGSNYPLLLDHIRREAEHFRRLLRTLPPIDPIEDILQREVFWLRIMKEHIEFIIHLLDPSQRELIEQAQDFRKTFSRLLETARDLLSMQKSKPRTFNTVARFTESVEAATTELSNFKGAAHEFALLCQILSIIPDPLLLDHVRREADKFLQEIEDLKGAITRVR